jgi:phage-related protein
MRQRKLWPVLEKPIHWIGSSLDDLSRFPVRAKRTIGYALRLAQRSELHPGAKPMHGRLRDVVEIVAHDDTGRTFRAMYCVKLHGILYVLHVFNKKATHGAKTPQRELDVVERRLEVAKRHHEEHYGKKETS